MKISLSIFLILFFVACERNKLIIEKDPWIDGYKKSSVLRLELDDKSDLELIKINDSDVKAIFTLSDIDDDLSGVWRNINELYDKNGSELIISKINDGR